MPALRSFTGTGTGTCTTQNERLSAISLLDSRAVRRRLRGLRSLSLLALWGARAQADAGELEQPSTQHYQIEARLDPSQRAVHGTLRRARHRERP